MEEVFLGRQPILDRNQNLVAFELLFRAGEVNEANVTNDVHASASVMVNAYGQLGIQRVLGQQRGFINISTELLMSDAIMLLPSNHIVLELLESIEITDQVVTRCLELKQMGYHLALDDVTEINSRTERMLPIVNVVKLDVLAIEEAKLQGIINTLRRWPVILLAEKVDSPELAKRCAALGFDMFQGYHFAKPEIISGKRVDANKLPLLNLLTMVMGECEAEEIETELKHQPNLSYNLLRLVNSVGFGMQQRINSIKQAVIILGRQQLQRWVQLLLYTSDSSGDSISNALMQTAAVRGKLMELITQIDRPHDKAYQDRAFMVGIFSLLDTLLGIEMQQIVDKLNIPEELTQALLKRSGRLGRQLALIEANEKGDVNQVQNILKEINFLTLSQLTHAELEALSWTNRINETAH